MGNYNESNQNSSQEIDKKTEIVWDDGYNAHEETVTKNKAAADESWVNEKNGWGCALIVIGIILFLLYKLIVSGLLEIIALGVVMLLFASLIFGSIVFEAAGIVVVIILGIFLFGTIGVPGIIVSFFAIGLWMSYRDEDKNSGDEKEAKEEKII